MTGSLYDQFDVDYYKLEVTEPGVISVDFDTYGNFSSDHYVVKLLSSDAMDTPIAQEYAGYAGQPVIFDVAVTDSSLDYIVSIQQIRLHLQMIHILYQQRFKIWFN